MTLNKLTYNKFKIKILIQDNTSNL
jgi:hypothetical protein